MRMTLIIFCLSFALSNVTNAQENAASSVISKQFEALQSGDFERAIQFASPEIQKRFSNKSDFQSMVQAGFPMMLRPGELKLLDQKIEPPRLWQRVQVSNQDGSTHWFSYELVKFGAEWRINGVLQLSPPGETA